MRPAFALLLVATVIVLTWMLVDTRGKQADLEERIRSSDQTVQRLTALINDRRAQVERIQALQALLGQETARAALLESRFPKPGTTDCVLYWPSHLSPQSSQPLHEGTILAADPEANRYVISLGVEDGVRGGFTYIVARDGQYVATLEIDDVQAKQSAGRLVPDLSKEAARRGDKVLNAK